MSHNDVLRHQVVTLNESEIVQGGECAGFRDGVDKTDEQGAAGTNRYLGSQRRF